VAKAWPAISAGTKRLQRGKEDHGHESKIITCSPPWPETRSAAPGCDHNPRATTSSSVAQRLAQVTDAKGDLAEHDQQQALKEDDGEYGQQVPARISERWIGAESGPRRVPALRSSTRTVAEVMRPNTANWTIIPGDDCLKAAGRLPWPLGASRRLGATASGGCCQAAMAWSRLASRARLADGLIGKGCRVP